jgi:hypothetical protein
MASIIQIGEKWRAQVRKRGVRETRTFPTRKDAESWAGAIEAHAEQKRADRLLEAAQVPREPWKTVDPYAIPRFDLERFCGVYFLFDAGELVYIGQGLQVPRRVDEHCRKMMFDSWSWLPVPQDRLTQVEAYLIRKFKPRLNVTHAGPRRGKELAMTTRKAASILTS